MIEELAHMTALSPFAVLTILLMCLVCGFMVGQLLDTMPATIMVYFAFAGCTLLSNTLWRTYQISVFGDKDLEAILATTAGLICGVTAFVGLKLLLAVVFGNTKKIPKTDLSAVYAESNHIIS